MLAKVAARGLYDHLVEQEVGAYLVAARETYDLIVAADLLVYFGGLAPLFAAFAKVTRRGDLIAFNIEAMSGAEFAVLPSSRFAHAPAYLEGLAETDFILVEKREMTIRLEANCPVPGLLSVLKRR